MKKLGLWIFILSSFSFGASARECDPDLFAKIVNPTVQDLAILANLRMSNQRLEAMELELLKMPTVEQRFKTLEQLGYANRKSDPVIRVFPAKPIFENEPEEERALRDKKVVYPFYEVQLPFAKVSFFHPKHQIGNEHRGLMVFLPGVGGTFSIAQGLFDAALSFHKRSRNRGQNRERMNALLDIGPFHRSLQVASFPMDLPMNGTGSDAPSFFLREDAVLEVLRQAHLVLRILYPHKPFFIAGRSQGGLYGLSYVAEYRDVAGVIALNPSATDRTIIKASLERHEKDLAAIFKSSATQMHWPSWWAYEHLTPGVYKYKKNPPMPALILIGNQDPSYDYPGVSPRDAYVNFWREYQQAQPGVRTLIGFDGGHNLWNRQEPDLYSQVVSVMGHWIEGQIIRETGK